MSLRVRMTIGGEDSACYATIPLHNGMGVAEWSGFTVIIITFYDSQRTKYFKLRYFTDCSCTTTWSRDSMLRHHEISICLCANRCN
jgi:hypothetical protein